jgi:hypothetical protein
MADQASVNGGARARPAAPPVEGVVSNLADFSSNIASLAELQAKLAINELRLCARRAALSVVLVVVAILLVLAGLPVALIGVAEWLIAAQGLSRSAALLLAAGGALAVATLLVIVGLPLMRRSLDAFQYSREEFTRNIAWVKTVLAQSGRPAPRGRR